MEEITVSAGQRVRLMVRLSSLDHANGAEGGAVPNLHGDVLFRNSVGEGAFTVVGGPAAVLEHGDREVVLMLNGTAEGGLGRYVIERIQLALPHRAPCLISKDDPLFRSFAITVTGPEYPRVVGITQRPVDITWAGDADEEASAAS